MRVRVGAAGHRTEPIVGNSEVLGQPVKHRQLLGRIALHYFCGTVIPCKATHVRRLFLVVIVDVF